jgi:hypothetical protein
MQHILNIILNVEYRDCFIMRMFFEIQKPKTIFVPAPTTGLVKPFRGMAA